MFAYFRAPVPWRELARRTVSETLEDDCIGMAAQLAFYFFLSLFPAMLFLVSLLGYAPVHADVRGALAELAAFLPREILQFLDDQIAAAVSGGEGGLLTLGILGAIWSSSSAVTAIITALNRAYDIAEWRPWWKRRLIAIALTIALAVFFVTAFAFVVGGGSVAAWVFDRAGVDGLPRGMWWTLQWFIAIALVIVAIDLVYYSAPNAETPFVWVTPGSVLATALWLGASVGFKIYVQNFTSYTAVHGTIGAVIVLLLWFYLSGFALLIGAELNSEIDKARHAELPQAVGERKKIGPAAERELRTRGGSA